jgi:nucleotide-sensitive chloride channel 1A
MHAVATDPDSVDKPCLYVQLDVEEPETTLEGGYDDDEDAEGPVFPEFRLIPTDPATLDVIFDSFCKGAERNPDADAEEEGQGSLFFDQSEVLAGALGAAEIEEDVDELVGDDPDRFIDAEARDGEQQGSLPKSANGTL